MCDYLEETKRLLTLYLSHDLSYRQLRDGIAGLRRHAAQNERRRDPVVPDVVSTGTLASLLGFLEQLLSRAPAGTPAGSRSRLAPLIRRLLHGLARGRSGFLRRFLPRIFRELGPLRLCAVENPVTDCAAFGLERDAADQWVDVGLVSPRSVLEDAERIALIPFSVFTSRFFDEELPELVRSPRPGSVSRDPFTYHPENDQALRLAEQHAALMRRGPRFRYFVDDAGLAEIVLDTDSIEADVLAFAARLFCARNRVRHASLDDRLVIDSPDA